MSDDVADLLADNPRGISGSQELAPLVDIPEYAAEAGMSALLLAVGSGIPLRRDPYAIAKAANFDRLIFRKMPVVCTGPTGLLHVGKVTL